jgi:hypothetical protein
MNHPLQGFERETVLTVLNSKRVWLVHIIVNALLMAAFFYWTRIPEASGLQFALSVLSGLVIAFATLELHCATFDYFRPAGEFSLTQSLRRSAARVPAFLLWSIIFGLILWIIGQLWSYDAQIGASVRRVLPGFVRRGVTPRFAVFTVTATIWFLYFFLWPILCLPVGAQVAIRNFGGFLSAVVLRPVRSLRFWILYFVCFIIGAYLPYRLAWLTPAKPSSLSAQTWSMVIRLGLAYLLLVTAWLVLCAAIMRAIVVAGPLDDVDNAFRQKA